MEPKIVTEVIDEPNKQDRQYPPNQNKRGWETKEHWQGNRTKEKLTFCICVAMRGRNPLKPSDRTAGIPLKQRLEINSSGICNALTTVSKDCLVLEVSYDYRHFEKSPE